MLRFLFLKVDEVKSAKHAHRTLEKASLDPRLMHLLSARYV